MFLYREEKKKSCQSLVIMLGGFLNLKNINNLQRCHYTWWYHFACDAKKVELEA